MTALSTVRPVWVASNKVKFVATDGIESSPYIIPQIELLESSELEEYMHWMSEDAEKEINGKRDEPRVQMTESQQHDLGNILHEIKDSRQYERENNHGRWWLGTK